LGDPDRSGLRYSGCLFRKWGRGWCGYFHHLPSISSSLTAGDRGNTEPGCRCPTGPALRPTNKRGVSGKPGWGVSPQAPEGNRREWHGRGGIAKTPGRAHSSGLYTGVRNPPWGTGRGLTGTACQFAALLTELRNLVGWRVRVTATQLVGHKSVRPSRDRLTGDPLGATRRTVGVRLMAGGVARRNLRGTGKPRGRREISARASGGDQATRLNQHGSQFPGYLICPVVSWRDIAISTRAESLDRHPEGFHPQGRP
jgi:hypothetical protein